MLIKEYRISLPMSVEEYRIAQLYMIQKKSREESQGTESGIEIIENKPYVNGPGGDGQYTYKIYHIGSHLPGWFRAILPKSALRVEEEAWNAYPYTKTRYKCPFIEKFLLEVETRYLNDGGDDDGIFNLTKSEKSQRTVDYIDIVKDAISSGDYRKEEDTKIFVSKKTGRGPLQEDWRQEYGRALREGRGEMMTAFKLCKVEFKYWGMQNKIERFIHDVALRKTMLRAHRQAWCWQDEYYGLSLDDIRRLERETQLALAAKMAADQQEAEGGGDDVTAASPQSQSAASTPVPGNGNEVAAGSAMMPAATDRSRSSVESSASVSSSSSSSSSSSVSSSSTHTQQSQQSQSQQQHSSHSPSPLPRHLHHQHQHQHHHHHSHHHPPHSLQRSTRPPPSVHFSGSVEGSPSHPNPHHQQIVSMSSSHDTITGEGDLDTPSSDFTRSVSQESTATVVNGQGLGQSQARRRHSQGTKRVSNSNLSASSSSYSPSDWSSLEKLQEPSSDEEFFDAQEDFQQTSVDMDQTSSSMMRSSSMDILPGLEDSMDSNAFAAACDATVDEPQFNKRVEQFRQMYSLDSAITSSDSSPPTSAPVCPTQILFLVLHGGNVMETSHDLMPKRRDLTNLRSTLDSVVLCHYQMAYSRIQLRLVSCPNMCRDSLNLLSSLSPFNVDRQASSGGGGGGSNANDVSLSWSHSFVPLGAIALCATAGPEYQDLVNIMVSSANQVYHDFLQSEEGQGFSGQVCLLADATGSLLAYDALIPTLSPFCRGGSRYGSHESMESTAIASELSGYSSSCPRNPAAATNNNAASATGGGATMDENSRELSQSDPSLHPKPVAPSTASLITPPQRTERSKSEINPPQGLDMAGYRKAEDSITAPGGSRLSSRHNSGHLTTTTNSTTEGGHQTTAGYYRGDGVDRRTSSGSHYGGGMAKFDFDVSDVFMCGSPLGMVLAYRQMANKEDGSPPRPACHQVYNMFHSSDPTAFRLEPLVHEGFKHISPMNVCRYSKFPLGDGEPVHVVETIQKFLKFFTASSLTPAEGGGGGGRVGGSSPSPLQRQASLSSMTSTCSGLGENMVSSITNVTQSWWGVKRVDYVLYSPEALHSFPVSALPHLFHSSFWESTDVIAFILRQVLKQHDSAFDSSRGVASEGMANFKIKTPLEKWQRRRTTIKVRNLQPNHRANDVIVLEDKPQVLTAKFVYGSLDIASLTGEKVDVNVMKQPPDGDWTLIATEVTDSHGRFSYTIPPDKKLPQGMYPVKLVVKGDHTTVDFFLTVLPPKTETVVFSIDGSFTASVSIMGKDPKVRAGAVDVVRHWQDLGYLILYVSARPDLQHRKVVAWLAQHNFPHGMLAFMDRLSKDPIRQKMLYIKSLQTEANIELKAAYGSSKDISIYKDLGLLPHQIFIVGKVSKKHYTQAQVISDGYSVHLSQLMSPGFTRPAVGNARMFLRKSNFRLTSNQGSKHHRDSKKLARRTISTPSSHTRMAGDQFLENSTGTRIVVQDFSSSGGGGGGKSRGAAASLQLTPDSKSTQV